MPEWRWLRALPQVNACERRLFFIPSFKIYGSVAGFYDYGPPGCSIKQNVTALWRQHFVLEESMLEARPLRTPASRPSGPWRSRSLQPHRCAVHQLSASLGPAS